MRQLITMHPQSETETHAGDAQLTFSFSCNQPMGRGCTQLGWDFPPELALSRNPVTDTPQGQSLLSSAILDPVKLIINIKHHRTVSCSSMYMIPSSSLRIIQQGMSPFSWAVIELMPGHSEPFYIGNYVSVSSFLPIPISGERPLWLWYSSLSSVVYICTWW